ASNGRIIEYSYDPMGRVIAKKDCEAVTRYAYTGTGKLKSIIDALGNETRYTYNELDLLCRIERFDGLSNNEASADIITDSSETDFGVDFVNVTIEDAEGISEANAEEKEHSYPQIDRHGHVTIYTHDLSGKVISVTDALGNKDVYKYNRKCELCAETDRDGNETIYTRDNNGNITGIKYSNGEEIKYSYNALNILKEVEDHLGITRIDSDPVGRTTQVTTPDGQSVGYEYGPDDAKTAIIYPDGKRLEYKYDAFRKLVELSDLNAATGSVKYYYDSNARLMKKAFPNGTTTSYDYYQGGLLKTLINTDREGVLDRFDYSYNQKGNRTSIEKTRRGLRNESGIYAYSYDEVGRLEEVSREGEVLSSYTYDAFGNRISKIENNSKTFYAYDVQDRLVSKSNQNGVDPTPVITTYSYDNRGNLVAEYKNDVLDREYTFGARNLLEKAKLNADPSKDQSISYDYNYLGQRVRKRSANGEVSYLTDITMDHNNLLAQSVNGKTSMFTYDDKVVSMENESTNAFYLLDELGSTMYITDVDGISSEAYEYDVFGNRLDVSTGKKAVLDSLIQPFTFTGYREEENGLCFAQARSYDPETGRFIGEDKVRGFLEIPDSINHYIYCYNDPKAYVDRNGLTPTDPGQGNSSSQPNGPTSSTTTSGASSSGGSTSGKDAVTQASRQGYADGSENLSSSEATEIKRKLHELGLSDEAIEEALDNGFTLKLLLDVCNSFDSKEASQFFNMVLEQKCTEAFDYLAKLQNPYLLIDDDNLMSALSLYSLNMVKLNADGTVTKASEAKFEAFVTGVLNAKGELLYFAPNIFERLYVCSTILAQGYNNSVLFCDFDSIGLEAYRDLSAEARKRMTITNFFGIESLAIQETSMYTGSPDIHADIHFYNCDNLTVDNCWTDVGYFSSTPDKKTLNVNLLFSAAAIKDQDDAKKLNDLIAERDKLVWDLAQNVLSDTSTAIHPLLGAFVKLTFGLSDSFSTSNLDDLKSVVDESLKLSGKSIPDGFNNGYAISKDAFNFVKDYMDKTDEIEKCKQDITNVWFGYCYGYDYDTSGGLLFPSKEVADRTTISYNPIRPDAYQVMQEWEEGGVYRLIRNSEAYRNDPNVDTSMLAIKFSKQYNEMVVNSDLTDSQKELAKNLAFGKSDGSFDLRNVDAADFNKCMRFLNSVYSVIDDGGHYSSVHELWDGRVQQFGGR
ncbi:RHS repeat protein, partial [Butyrivibrio proteoclasticus]|uniref:RHS repeat protein n=1 Tax=Butyrivibrio proteoclasticus TaxID=43305 RepID=UPI00054D98A6